MSKCRFDMDAACVVHGGAGAAPIICTNAAAALKARVAELQAAFDKAGDGPRLHLRCQRRERALEARVRELEAELAAIRGAF